MLTATLALALSILLGSNSPHPPGPTGSELLRACGAAVRQADGAELDAEDAVRAVWCTGYVGGFLDGLAILSWKGGATKVCLPANGIENEQAARVIVRYLRDHPEQLHESGRALLITAIGEAFRCKS